MFRQIFLPGALLMSCLIGFGGYSLWDTYHRQFNSTWSAAQAFSGDVSAQRRLASCYATGCITVPHDQPFACAWREIILEESSKAPPADVSAAQAACSHLSALQRQAVKTLTTDIRQQIRDDAEIHLGSHRDNAAHFPKT